MVKPGHSKQTGEKDKCVVPVCQQSAQAAAETAHSDLVLKTRKGAVGLGSGLMRVMIFLSLSKTPSAKRESAHNRKAFLLWHLWVS